MHSATAPVITQCSTMLRGINPDKGPELREKWEAMGFTVISMADDWATIYGENVQKTELPGIIEEEELANAA